MSRSPVLAVTAGDPAGIGPEVCLQLLQACEQPENHSLERMIPVLFGDLTVFEKLVETPACQKYAGVLQHLPRLHWQDYLSLDTRPDSPLLVDMQSIAKDQIAPGQVRPAHGQSAYLYIERAIQQALTKRVDGIVTGPINKEALQSAGYAYPGHTEILTEQTKAESSVMMLTSPEITCSLVTAHVGLHEVPKLLSVELIYDTILKTDAAMKKMRGQPPRLTVCGLNPHAGEHGLFGNQEEERLIIPAMKQAALQGIHCSGPFPPDTAFMPRRRQQTDAYICMYHDQGLIPLKALAFEEAVNVTLGLPIVRTSVDHGTAFDIAWQGIAGVGSMIQAVNLACRLCRETT